MSIGMPWADLSECFAFLGNTLLSPMTKTKDVGLDPTFWEEFPDFGSKDVRAAVRACQRGAFRTIEKAKISGRDPVVECSFEHARLFVGPPRPAVWPWETLDRGECTTAGFGEPTFQMRVLLRDAGLQLSNENRQYEDHLGIELLYLSELCRRNVQASASVESIDANMGNHKALRAFLEEHPLAWIDSFEASVCKACPDGYFAGIATCVRALLRWLEKALRVVDERCCF